jgi:2-iminoacetate synthase ThiH
MAGADWGIEMTPDGFDDAIRAIGRIPAVRTTTYDRIERVDLPIPAQIGQPN